MRNKIPRQILIKVLITILVINYVTGNLGLNMVTPTYSSIPPARYSIIGSVLFSGQNMSGIHACPWILNLSDSSIIGPNIQFREYLNNSILTEIEEYPWIDSEFSIQYEAIWHDFNNCSQWYWNDTDYYFDPYYAQIRFNFEAGNETLIELWTNEAANALTIAFI